jgi:hypothetical protein
MLGDFELRFKNILARRQADDAIAPLIIGGHCTLDPNPTPFAAAVLAENADVKTWRRTAVIVTNGTAD